jgi:hypothetical protein
MENFSLNLPIKTITPEGCFDCSAGKKHHIPMRRVTIEIGSADLDPGAKGIVNEQFSMINPDRFFQTCQDFSTYSFKQLATNPDRSFIFNSTPQLTGKIVPEP